MPLNNLYIPTFQQFITVPFNATCQQIDSTRLLVEILGWLESAAGEFNESSYSSKILLDGSLAIVIRYKRERDGKYRPACTMGYDMDESGGIRVNQIQGSRDKSIAFRFHSSFRTSAFLLKFLEESFIKKWIPVYMEMYPPGIENASYASGALDRYRIFRTALLGLNDKYFWEKLCA